MSIHVVFALAALCLCAPVIEARSRVVVTLSSVGDRVRAQNPDLAAARLRIHEAAGRARQSGRLANPELETSYEQNPSSREGRVEIGIFQKFPVTNRLHLEKEITGAAIQSAEAEVRDVERRLTAEARALVVRCLVLRERHGLLARQAAMAEAFAGQLAASAAKGEAAALDAGQARLEAGSVVLEQRRIRLEESGLLDQLKLLLGMPPDAALVVSGRLPEMSLPASPATPGARPDYQAARLDERVAAGKLALAHARRHDDIEGGLFASGERSEDAPLGYENEAVIGLRVSFALPFWNRNEGEIGEARAVHERKRMETAALAAGIRHEAAAALAAMRQWADVARETGDTLLPLADEQVALAEKAFRSGQGDLQAVFRAREKHLQLFLARLDALREYHLARVRHEAALGHP